MLVVRCKRRNRGIDLSVTYKRAVESVSERGDDEHIDLIPEPDYLKPCKSFKPVSQPFSFKRSTEKTMSIKRQNLMSSSVKYDDQYIYAEIMPPGQGMRYFSDPIHRFSTIQRESCSRPILTYSTEGQRYLSNQVPGLEYS